LSRPSIFNLRELRLPQLKLAQARTDGEAGFGFHADRLKRNGGVAAAHKHVCATANANRSVSRCANIIADEGASAVPQRRRCVNAPDELRLIRYADVGPDPPELANVTLVAAVNARKNATRLLDGCDDSADLRRANAAQSTNADSRVRRRSTAKRKQSARNSSKQDSHSQSPFDPHIRVKLHLYVKTLEKRKLQMIRGNVATAAI
jgi:hypothetical protein